jgi:hypothetical protein
MPSALTRSSNIENFIDGICSRMTNILTDVTQREPPPALAKDAQDLEKVLRAIANRFPFTGNQPEKILALTDL